MEDRRITYFATTNIPSRQDKFGIRSTDRDKHMYVIGKTGTGKSTMLEHMVVQDIKMGESVVFIDPHGLAAERILEHIPQERIDDVLYFAPHDVAYPIAFNVLDEVDYDKRHIVVHGVLQLFEKMWDSKLDPKTRYILNNVLLALLEDSDASLLDVYRVFDDAHYRMYLSKLVKDTTVKEFFEKEFLAYTEEFLKELSTAVSDNIRRIVGDPVIRNIVAHPNSSFDMRKHLNDRKIVIVNLAKSKIGVDNARFLGSTLITRVYDAVFDRANTNEFELEGMPQTYLYIDEFQSFSNKSFIDMFSEARKYKLSLTIAHQYTGQMSAEVRNAIFGNVGTIVSFALGSDDAPVLAQHFSPSFSAEDLTSLPLGGIYLTLMIDGSMSEPFSADTFSPLETPRVTHKDQVIAASRRKYSVAPVVPIEPLQQS